MQFTKLFNSILDSTIWQESKDTKLVWITMLAMSDKNGEIHASIPGLAVRSGVSIAECEQALQCLLAPDKYSRTKDDEGRRIAEVDGGWRLINHPKYRALLSAEERREYLAKKQRDHRSKSTVNNCQQLSTNVNKCSDKSTMSTHTEAEAEAEALREREASENRIPFLETRSVEFLEAWERWKRHSRDNGKPIGVMSEEAQLVSLAAAYPVETEAIKAIEFSLKNNWRNIDLKNSHNQKDDKPRPAKASSESKLDSIFKASGL